MKVKLTLPETYWSQMNINKVFTVVRDDQFKKNRLYVVCVNGEPTGRKIKDTECEKLDYSQPLYINQLRRKEICNGGVSR